MSSKLTRALRVLAGILGSSTASRGSAAIFNALNAGVLRGGYTTICRNRRSSRAKISGQSFFFEPLEDRQLMSTYYISLNGNDSNKGTTAATAWKTIAKINATNFAPGDKILFQGGQTFSGSVQLTSKDGNSQTNPVVVSSYGTGDATISSGGSTGIHLFDTGGIWIENLNITGTPSSGSQAGIQMEGLSGNFYHANVRVEGCNISGYYQAGILIEGDYSNAGYNGVLITDNQIHGNVMTGIQACAPAETCLQNLEISYNNVYGNYGDGKSICTGSGIMLGDVSNTVVEYNNAYLNGVTGGNGNVGIWAYQSNNVTFQYNASYQNHTTRGLDGDGFDFDSDVSNSVIQYNYAADNYGSGIQLDQWRVDGLEKNDIVRYNVMVDNGRYDNYGNMEAWGQIINSYYYNNTIYTTPAIGGVNSAIRIHNSAIPGIYLNGVHFADNIIITSGNTLMLKIPTQELIGAKNLTFTDNVYYAVSGTVQIGYGGSIFTTLAQWQKAGYETLNGKGTGLFVNPNLSQVPVATAAFTSTTLRTDSAFRLAAGSPALAIAFDAAAYYGLPAPTADYYGDALPSNLSAVPGADQSLKVGRTGSTSAPSVSIPPVVTPPATTTTSTTNTSSSTTTTTPAKSTTTTAPAKSTTTTTTTTSSKPATVNPPSTTPVTSTPVATLVPATGLKALSIGTVGGSKTTASGSSYTIAASGADIWGTSDDLQYDYTTMTGNGTIVAQVSSMTFANTWAKAGVMFRNGTGSNAAEVSALITPEQIVATQTRATTGSASNTFTSDLAGKGDDWVKLVRNGNTFTSYVSTNGTSWVQLDSVNVAMGSTVDVGLAVTSHSTGAVETAKFSNVQIT